MNFADYNRKQNEKTAQTAKSIIALNKGYQDRDNEINGYGGSASQILVSYSKIKSSHVVGSSGNNTAGA